MHLTGGTEEKKKKKKTTNEKRKKKKFQGINKLHTYGHAHIRVSKISEATINTSYFIAHNRLS